MEEGKRLNPFEDHYKSRDKEGYIMQTADWIAAVGSGATAIGTLAAFLTVYITVRNYQKDLKQQQTTQIRQSLRILINQSYILTNLLTDGSLLIFGSSAIAKELYSRLGPTADRKEFWRYLHGDSNYLLSVAVVGWHSSPQTTLLMDAINLIEQHVLTLNGGLTILLYPIQMMRSIINDGCSPIIFYQTLTAMKEADTFFQNLWEEKNVDKLVGALTVELQSNASTYFVIRYENAINQLRNFIKEVSNKLIDLDDVKLLEISKVDLRDVLSQATRTGSMKVLLEKLKKHFSTPKTYNILLEMINEIEVSISKEEASKMLKNIKNLKM